MDSASYDSTEHLCKCYKIAEISVCDDEIVQSCNMSHQIGICGHQNDNNKSNSYSTDRKVEYTSIAVSPVGIYGHTYNICIYIHRYVVLFPRTFVIMVSTDASPEACPDT